MRSLEDYGVMRGGFQYVRDIDNTRSVEPYFDDFPVICQDFLQLGSENLIIGFLLCGIIGTTPAANPRTPGLITGIYIDAQV